MKYSSKDEFPNKNGIYIIGFNKSKKVYVGSTSAKGRFIKSGFSLRWKHHLYRLKKGIHEKKLQNAYNKYGEKNIFFEIIELCEEKEKIEKENFWINFYNSYKNGYNSQEKAEPTIEKLNKYKSKIKKIRKEKSSNIENIILDLYNKGLSNLEISKIAKLNKNTITKYLKKNKIKNINGQLNRAKSIYCFNKNTKEIKKYNSVYYCSRDLNINQKLIYNILNKKNKTAKGYSFSYTELNIEEFEKFIKKESKWKKLSQK